MPLIVWSLLLHGLVGWRLLPALGSWPAAVSLGAALLVSALTLPRGLRRIHEPGVAATLQWIGLVCMGWFSSLFVLTLLRDVALLAALGVASAGWAQPDLDAAARLSAGALAGAPADAAPRILLAHQPRSAAAAAAAGFDLQLSGHTHGGQFWPWNLFVPLQQPFVAGLHRLDRLLVYVSRGTGYWGPPKRFGAPPEITLLRLVPAAG